MLSYLFVQSPILRPKKKKEKKYVLHSQNYVYLKKVFVWVCLGFKNSK